MAGSFSREYSGSFALSARVQLERGNVQVLEIDGIDLLDLLDSNVAAIPSPFAAGDVPVGDVFEGSAGDQAVAGGLEIGLAGRLRRASGAAMARICRG